MKRLPALRMMAKEVLRWKPVTASGIPHMTTKDDIHEGLWIPQGTNGAGQSMVGDLPCTLSLTFQLQVLALAQRDTILTPKNNTRPFTATQSSTQTSTPSILPDGSNPATQPTANH